MRYDQLIEIARIKRPEVLIEIGTHRGERARQMITYCKQYFGFDLFEDGNDETDRVERNGKGRSALKQTAEMLGLYHRYQLELIQGNTRQTLPEFVKRGIKAQMCFVDGGHSIETIQSDWDNVRQCMQPGGIVVFDDYYRPQVEGFGCNEVVKSLDHRVLPMCDSFGGISIFMVRVDIP